MTRLMQLSDLHFGAEIPEAVEALIEAAERLQPDRILIGGDFTMRARKAEWKAAREFLDRLPAPTLSIPGNHDIPGINNLADRFFTPWKRYRQAIGEDLEPTETIGEIEVVGLNSARRFGAPSFDWSLGAVSTLQCLELPFRFRSDATLRAVILHHPLIAPPNAVRRLLKRNGMLMAAFEAAKVDLVMAGHYHQSHIDILPLPVGKRDIVLSHVSTACSWRMKGEPPGFHLIAASDGKIEVTRHRFDKALSRFDEDGTTSFQKLENRWVRRNATLSMSAKHSS